MAGADQRRLRNLEDLLDRIEGLSEEYHEVSFEDILSTAGQNAFGPFILIAGLIIALPLVGDIPGVPTLMGVFVLLIAGQLLFGRDHFWLPGWLLQRRVEKEKLVRAIGWMRGPARKVDRVLQPRLVFFTKRTGFFAIAATCVVISLTLPVMEVVPFSANGAGAALMAFGLAILSHDGLLALVAFLVTAATYAAVLAVLI
jgi:hypothetical protein